MKRLLGSLSVLAITLASISNGCATGVDPDVDGPLPAPATFALGGTVTGLVGPGLVLQNAGGDPLTIDVDGTFTFPTRQRAGAKFDVSVRTQPAAPDQICSVSGGSGTVGTGDVRTVVVNCAPSRFTVGGTVTGLGGKGLVLQNAGGAELAVTANGGFAFPETVETGAAYDVTVKAQPKDLTQTCTVTSGSGTVGKADVENVAVTCVTKTYTVGGAVSGLAGTGLVLQESGANDLPVPADGPFTFAPPRDDGSAYAVSVKTQPLTPSQTCTVTAGTGKIAGANVTSASVACVTNTFTVGGTVTGLDAPGLVLTNNGGNDVSVASGAAAFTFAARVPSGGAYGVAVKTQPTGKNCIVTKGTGLVGATNVTDVEIRCVSGVCKAVGGVRWCLDPVAARSCNAFCSELGYGNPTITDSAWTAAQDSNVECQALATAFGVTFNAAGFYQFACAEVTVATGELYCSTASTCPAEHRTGADADYRGLCPCQ